MRTTVVEEVWCAMNRMRIKKASGPSEIALKLFRAGGDNCLKYFTNIFKAIFFNDKLLEKWILSSLVQILKGKGDPLNTEIGSCFLYLLTGKRL